MLNWISNLTRNAKRLLALSADLVILPFAIGIAFTLRLEEFYVPDARVATVIFLTTITSASVFIRLGLYRAVIRYAGLQMFNTIFIGVSVSVFFLAVLGFLLQANIPKSVPFIYFGIALMGMSASRLVIRHILRMDRHQASKNVVIYGAGSAGLQLSTALFHGNEYEPIAFVDDDKLKCGSIANGLRIYEQREFAQLVSENEIHEVLLAISNLSHSRRRKIVHELGQFNIPIKTIPGIKELIDGSSQIQEIRDVKVEELLGREIVPPDPELLDSCIKGKPVMITGAGGSIGSELSRQIAQIGPSLLVLVEHSEFALYSIEQELLERDNKFPIQPILANVRDEKLLKQLMIQNKIETVYHAAAYKHVPLVEQNIISGVLNNVYGTLSTARAAKEANVSNFILISTDKAVRPTNLMGATKRLAEQILQNFAEQSSDTKFCMVRFGNVLASSGSVVPRFRKQIESGGPVTVTHPEITRFFMTIPEAVQLVIQAGPLSTGGDVFVLNMGEPVKILTLAETLIRLLGKSIQTEDNPSGEIEIQFTGLRPGEKLYEELLLDDRCSGTKHPMITRATESKTDAETLENIIQNLQLACADHHYGAIIKLVCLAVPEYKPSESMELHNNATQKNNVYEIKPNQR